MEIRFSIKAGCLAKYPETTEEAQVILKRLARRRIKAEVVSDGKVIGGVREVDGKYKKWMEGA